MNKRTKEEEFNRYREALRREGQTLSSAISLYRHIYERKKDRLDELNCAPAFFQVTLAALLNFIIMWVNKLFFDSESAGFLRFLNFVGKNLDLFSTETLKKRRNFKNNHWFLKEHIPIKPEMIREDKKRIRGLKPVLKNIETRRNKLHAHFDSAYFFKDRDISKDAPILWKDLDKIKELISHLVNRYSAAFDGNLFQIEPINIFDIDNILDDLHKYKKILESQEEIT